MLTGDRPTGWLDTMAIGLALRRKVLKVSGLFYFRILLRPPGCDVVWLLGVLSCLVCFGLGVLFVCCCFSFIARSSAFPEQSLFLAAFTKLQPNSRGK